jgi:hypothetical protein
MNQLIYRGAMSSLYGVETEQDCREEIDEVLQSPALCGTINKETISALKSRLAVYHQKGNNLKGRNQMSRAERVFFWAAIHKAYTKAPNINARHTWRKGLQEIESNLKYYRPKERAHTVAKESKQRKLIQERMQQITTALRTGDPKGVMASEFGKDSVTLGAIRTLLKLRYIGNENGKLYKPSTP